MTDELKAGQKLKKWRGNGRVVGGKYLGIVEAYTEAEAIEKFEAEAFVRLCNQCADECEDPEVDNITVEEDTE